MPSVSTMKCAHTPGSSPSSGLGAFGVERPERRRERRRDRHVLDDHARRQSRAGDAVVPSRVGRHLGLPARRRRESASTRPAVAGASAAAWAQRRERRRGRAPAARRSPSRRRAVPGRRLPDGCRFRALVFVVMLESIQRRSRGVPGTHLRRRGRLGIVAGAASGRACTTATWRSRVRRVRRACSPVVTSSRRPPTRRPSACAMRSSR